MKWTLTEIIDKDCKEPVYYESKEAAFEAMCYRVSWLTGVPAEDIAKECLEQIIWTVDISNAWAVVGKTFAWINGDTQYDWDIREVA